MSHGSKQQNGGLCRPFALGLAANVAVAAVLS
jgi:hypothetical protein